MTSNIGSAAIAASGARTGDAAYEAMKREVTEALGSHFRPEFLNRVDEVIVFHALTEADLERIVGLLVADLAQRLAAQDIALELTDAARALLVREGTDPAYGARPLKRTIQRLVENPLARAIVAGEFKPGDTRDGRRRPRLGDARLLDGTAHRRHASAPPKRDARTRRVEPVAPVAGRRPAELGRRRSTVVGGCVSTSSSSVSRHSPRSCRPRPTVLMPVIVGGMEGRRPPRDAPAGRPGRPAGVLVLLYPDDGRSRPRRPDRAGDP